KLNETTVLEEAETGITYIDCIELASSNKGARQQTTKKIVICGTEMAADEYKTVALANLDKEYAKYILEDTEAEDGTTIKATHSINATRVTSAYETGKTAINAATALADIQIAYSTAIGNLQFVESDAKVAELRAGAIAQIDEAYPKSDYTFEGLTGDDAIYNNKADYEEIHDAVVAHINTLCDVMSINLYTGEVLDGLDSPFAETQNDFWMLYDKMVAVNEAIAEYKADEIEAIMESHETTYAEIQALITDGVGRADPNYVDWENNDVANYETIAAINKAYTDVTKAINSLIQSTNERFEETVARLKGEIDEYATTAKTDIEDTTVTAAIDAAAQAGKDAIDAVQSTDENALKTINTASTNAQKAIDLIVLKHEAKQDVKAYGEQVITEQSLTDADLIAAIRGIDTSAIDNATSATVSGKADEVKAAIDLLVAKYNAKITVAQYATTKKAEVVGRDDVIEDIDNVNMDEIDAVTKEANIEDAINKVKAKIDKIVSDLYNSYVQVTVYGYGAVGVKYGSKLTADKVYVTGMNVTAIYTDEGKATAIPEDGLTVYSATTVYVDLEDKESLVNTSSWNATSESNSTGLFNVVLPASAVKLSKGDANGNKAFNGTKLNEITYNDVITLGNISKGDNNQATPLTIEVKSALKSLTVCTRVAESTGGSARSGKTYYYVNGVKVKELNTVEAFEPLTNLNAGDVVTVWAENTGSGGHFYICNVAAEIDTSKTPKLVTVEWLNGDGTVWKTTTHSYLETITAPELDDDFVADGVPDGWLYNNEELSASLKLASSGTAYQMVPNIKTADITISYTDGTPADEPLKYLSSQTGNELPEPENGDETHLFIGYYLQAGDEPADTDEVFDLSVATAGTYTVYAKYLEANVTIIYKDNADDAGETVKLFKKADGSLVTAEDKAATLKSAPTAPADTPVFSGWVYMDGEEEVVLDLADVEAGETYTVTAAFEALSITESHLDQSNMPTDNVAVNGTIADTDLFTVNALVAMNAKTQAANKALTLQEKDSTKTFSGKLLQTARATDPGYCISITAKYAITLDIYYNINKEDLTQEGRKAKFQYVIGDGDMTSVDYTSVNKGYNKLTITLQQGDVLKMGYVEGNNSNTCFALFGIDANVV
ncbi:MAG: hypothetical protein K2N14_01085, partial [Clostridia bacterium]|nr:hypothetical protein [Clostridia bacterium]